LRKLKICLRADPSRETFREESKLDVRLTESLIGAAAGGAYASAASAEMLKLLFGGSSS